MKDVLNPSEFTYMQIEKFMKENGEMVRNMERGLRNL